MRELDKEQIVSDLHRFKNRILNSKLAELVYAREILFIIDALDLIVELTEENKKLKAFKGYFDALYGRGLEVTNLYLSDALESFDRLYENAQELFED